MNALIFFILIVFLGSMHIGSQRDPNRWFIDTPWWNDLNSKPFVSFFLVPVSRLSNSLNGDTIKSYPFHLDWDEFISNMDGILSDTQQPPTDSATILEMYEYPKDGDKKDFVLKKIQLLDGKTISVLTLLMSSEKKFYDFPYPEELDKSIPFYLKFQIADDGFAFGNNYTTKQNCIRNNLLLTLTNMRMEKNINQKPKMNTLIEWKWHREHEINRSMDWDIMHFTSNFAEDGCRMWVRAW